MAGHPQAWRGADAYTRADSLYRHKGARPLPLAAMEVAESGRRLGTTHVLRLLAVFCFGAAVMVGACVFAMAVAP
jgi:hypothetical protein